MSKKYSRSKKPILNKKRLVAGAAVVGLTAGGVDDADAQLIIRNLSQTVDQSSFNFDLDQDGTNDFQIQDGPDSSRIKGLGSGDEIATNGLGDRALLFNAGDTVDGSPKFRSTPYLYRDGDIDPGEWDTVGTEGYVGLRIRLGGDTHYGWLHVTRGSTILGQVAFNPAPGVGAAITAVPEPSSLAHLALVAIGSAGIATIRRRRKSQGEPLTTVA